MRTLVLAAAALASAAVSGPASAWPFRSKPAPSATAQAPGGKSAAANAQAANAATGPRKATPEQRAQAERLEPVARAAFWAREVDVDSRDAEAGLKFARDLRMLGRNEEAAAAADRVLVFQPDSVDALLEMGRDQIARDQGFFAIEPLQRAAALAPKDWRPLSLMGVALQQVRRTDDARQAWAKALTLSPENPAVLSNMAMAEVAAGRAMAAEPLLRRAVAQSGATLQTRQNLALVLGLDGKTAEAERLLREDLPPELADQNLAWLSARQASPSAPTAAVTPPPQPSVSPH